MKTYAKTWGLLILFALVLAAVSCNRNKAEKGTATLPPEHAKAVEAYNKSIEESKKIIAAKVNGAGITMNDLVREMNSIAKEVTKPGQKRDPHLDKKVRKEALDRLIYRELAVQEAVRQGMNVPPQVVSEEMQKARTRFKTEDDFRASLAEQGITEEELRKLTERGLLVDMITEKEIFDRVKVDPALVKKTYEKEKASYKSPAGKQLSFEEARPIIEQKLMTPLVQKREDAWLDSLKKAAKIEITLGESAREIHRVQ
jgi:SurA-like N-terminal domain